MMKISIIAISITFLFFSAKNQQQKYYSTEIATTTEIGKYKIVDTGQKKFFNNDSEIEKPEKQSGFYGQDAHFIKNSPSYIDNNDGTITDKVTGLIWQKSYEVMSYSEALKELKSFKLVNQTDWRLPSIKEAYSLMDFSGVDPSGKEMNKTPPGAIPFINTDYFDFEYGSNGERIIDVQILSSTIYKGKTMGRNETVFGVNLADGRIKGYPLIDPRSRAEKKYTVRFVRGNTEYGKNNFQEKDEVINDLASGLMWQKEDSKKGMNWQESLIYAKEKNSENYLGYNDWRLPNAKELQSIVDYSKSPQHTNSAAIDKIFDVSTITDEGGSINYPSYWTSTTHKSVRTNKAAVYICFGEALGFFAPPHSSANKRLVDVHGAGAQRSDPKTGNKSAFPEGRGPQGDVIRIDNYVRLVRDNN